jgi:hypothetical protein
MITACILWIHCESEYSERYLYIAVVGDYGIPFTGSYGDQYDQHEVLSATPDYFSYHLRELDNHFVGTFHKTKGTKKDFQCLTVRLYLKEYPEPSSLLAEISQTNPDSMVVVTYHD